MDAVNAVNKAFYFIHNAKFVRDENGQYYPEVILKAEWPCGLPHAKAKWMRIIKANHDTTLSMLAFYAELDNQHRRVMTEWVMENYNCGGKEI